MYDHPVTETERELVSEVETEVIADFPPGVRTEFLATFLAEQSFPDLPEETWWLYVRRETYQ